MDKKTIKSQRALFLAAIFCILILIVIPQNVYAKEKKRVTKEYTYKTWITVGDTVQLHANSVKKFFGVKNSKSKVTFSTDSGSGLKVTKNGLVSVKKPDKTCKNYKYGRIKAVFTYKNTEYTYWRKFVITYEYDDNNPISRDVSPEQIKRFKNAYKTGNTSKLISTEKKIFKNVKKAVNYSKSGKNRYEKLKRLNDWITKNVKYTHSEKNKDIYTIKGALLDGQAVCNGYTNAFKLCASVMGIPCEMVLGCVDNNPFVGHSWNIVKLEDGKWYHIDVTYNDTDSPTKYSYTTYNNFCLTDKQMKQDGHRWYDSKKCNGKKYNFTNYEKNYFVDSEQDMYNAVKQAVKDKKEYVFFYKESPEGELYEVQDILVSEYIGKNIRVQKVSKYGDIPIDIPGYTMPASICPNNKKHAMRLYKITYLSDEKFEPFKYICNGNEMAQLIQDAVANGKTVIKNVAICEDYDESGLYCDESGYVLCRKNIRFSSPGGYTVPAFFKQDRKNYEVTDIYVDYSGINERVYEVATEDDVNAALDDAIANRATQIYFYAPDYPKEKLVWITSGYEYDIYSIHNIHTYISPYGYVNPVTGESGDSFWVDVTIKYK